jgi:2-polyprenyl-3-methyl-5-hydroxy-6-metoxy-1,4-benzoquinol methylase
MQDDPSPAAVMDGLLGYVKTAALTAAIRLDVFTAIGDGVDAATQAQRTGAAERGIRALCDYLAAEGLLSKRDGVYRLGRTAARFLDRRSSAAMGAVEGFLASREMIDLILGAPTDCVKQGGASGLANVAADHPIWIKFARAMTPFAAPIAAATVAWLAENELPPRRVLDMAAGHGLYGISVARRFPGAEVVALDWGGVLEVARENAAAAGVAERFRWIAGDAFEVPLEGPYDVVLMPNFLHHFDEAGCVRLLRRARAALTPGGTVLAPEFVTDEDRTSPPMAAKFSFLMLATTPAGTAYTAAELRRMFIAAGFPAVHLAPLPRTPQTLVVGGSV